MKVDRRETRHRQPGYEGQRELSVERVRDPWPHPDKPMATIEVVMNVRESPIERLYRTHKIGEPAKIAADRFRALYEAAEIGSARGVDYQRPKVDGGQIARSTLAVAVAEAHKVLARIRRALGPRDYLYLSLIVGQGRSIASVAKSIDGEGLRLTREGVSWSLLQALDALVHHFGVVTGTASRIRAEHTVPRDNGP